MQRLFTPVVRWRSRNAPAALCWWHDGPMACQIHALLKQAIDQADPIRLLAIGAPQDEHESEIREIVSRLGECTTREEMQTLVHAADGG